MNMERIVEKTVKITLILNETEADWLNRLMQNEHVADNFPPTSETAAHAEMRAKFFHASNTRS
jgi:hypothetical protein